MEVLYFFNKNSKSTESSKKMGESSLTHTKNDMTDSNKFRNRAILEFNDILISKIKCRKCDSYFDTSYAQCFAGHTKLCSQCYSGFKLDCSECKQPLISIKGNVFTDIAKEFSFPCRFNKEGCSKRFAWNQITQHEKECDKRIYMCPTKPSGTCSWLGKGDAIQDHFFDNHPEKAIVAIEGIFPWFIDVNEDCNKTVMVISQNKTFLLHTFRLRAEGLYLGMQYIGSKYEAQQYEFEVKISDKKNAAYCVSFQIRPDYIDVLKPEQSIFLEENLLQAIAVNETTKNIPCKITIHSKAVAAPENDELLSEIECPICNDYLVPPIHMCVSGHSICINCKNKVKRCPTCQSNIGNARNYALESLTRRLNYPCGFSKEGCAQTFPSDKIREHENKCDFATYFCPLREDLKCSWKGKYSDAAMHSRKDHPSHFFPTSAQVITWKHNFDKNANNRQLMYTFEELFCVSAQCDALNNMFNLVVFCIAPKYSASKFGYTFEIEMENGKRKMMITDICKSAAETEDEIFARGECVSLSNENFKSFVKNNEANYKITITKYQFVW